MVIFVNPYTNKLTKEELTGAIPINIQTELNILHDVKDNNLPMYKLDDSGKKMYNDYTNNETTENLSFLEIGDTKKIGNLEYYEPSIYDNKNITVEKYRTELIKVTEENYDQFTLDEIMTLEYQNIINKIDYQFVVNNILENVDKTNSTFKSLNNYRCILNPGDTLIIPQIDLGENVEDVKLVNIDELLSITVNDAVVNNSECKLYQNFNILTVKLSNNTDKNVFITNPYLLCK